MSRSIKCAIVGQSLIEHDLNNDVSLDSLASQIRGNDFAFTNLEVSVKGSRGGWPMKPLDWCTRPSETCLDLLKELGFNALSLANNHAWDLGPTGLLDTIDEAEKRGFAHAGTGASLEDAQQPTFIETPNGRIALIAMASGNLPDMAFATSREECGDRARPGVNPLRVRDVYSLDEIGFAKIRDVMTSHDFELRSDGQLVIGDVRFAKGGHGELRRVIDPDDRERHIAIIRDAAKQSDLVIVYLHQHHWEKQWQDVGSWMQDFAHNCIDAGAHLFLGHGVPMLQAVEMYRGLPIVYGLGNFIFHPTAGQSYWPDPRCWQSVIMTANFEAGRWRHIQFNPISLGTEHVVRQAIPNHPSKKWPSIADGDYAAEILTGLKGLSDSYDCPMLINSNCATIDFGAPSLRVK